MCVYIDSQQTTTSNIQKCCKTSNPSEFKYLEILEILARGLSFTQSIRFSL